MLWASFRVIFDDWGSFWGHLVVILSHLGHIFCHLGGRLGVTWGHFGAPCVSSGSFWLQLCVICGHLGVTFGNSGLFFLITRGSFMLETFAD